MKAENGQLDVFVGPDLNSQKVYIIDQLDADTGRFDEHKAMVGFSNRGVALANYRRSFSDGKSDARIGAVTEMTMAEFKKWLKDGDTTKPARRLALAA